MITAYSPDTQDLSNNGLGVLLPTACIVKEQAGGDYSLEIEHPLDDDLRWQMLQRGFLIKAPVPERETPLIQQSAEARGESAEHIIWEVTASTGSVYTKPSTGYSSWNSGSTYNKGAKVNYGGKSYRWDSDIHYSVAPPGGFWIKITTGSKRIQKLKQYTEVIYHKDENSTWIQITTPDGTTGYMQKSSIAYKRTEPFLSAQPAYNTAVPPRQIRDQVFRIYDVQIDDNAKTVKASARHIHYDQIGNLIKSYNPASADLQAALIAMSADCLNEHDFSYYTNITDEITAEWARKNAIEVIHDPDNGAVPKLQAQLVRDNYDIFLLQNVERDRGVVIEYGKNLLGITSKANDEAAITRIMPIGYDADGKPILLPEECIDSPYIGEYPTVRAVPLDVQDAKVKAASGDDPGMTLEQANTKMREAAQAEFDKGCDLIDPEITVDFIHLGDTEEYKQYKGLQQVFLYDTVTVRHSRLGLDYKTQVVGYEFDAILGRYIKINMGSIKNGADLGAVAGFQLPSMGISGNKLVPGSVGSSHFQALSVLNAHIGNLDAGKINTGFLSAERIETESLDANKIKAHAITADQIAAKTITADQIAARAITADEMAVGTITAESGILANLSVTNAKIAEAGIDFLKVKDVIGNTAIFEELLGGKIHMSRLTVTEANIVDLTAGKLMVRGDDGAFYRLTVDGEGNVIATLTQVSNDNIADLSLDAGEKLIKSSITADCLDVDEIMGGSALIGKIQSGHIAAGAVETTNISAPAKAALTLMATNAVNVSGTNLIGKHLSAPWIDNSTYLMTNYVLKPLCKYGLEIPGGGASVAEIGSGSPLQLHLLPNTDYVLSFKAVCAGASETLVVDLYPDTLPQTTFTVTSNLTQFEWVIHTPLSSVTTDMYNCSLRFFNPTYYTYVTDICLSQGNKGAGWTVSPYDPASGVRMSYIQILDNALRMVTGGTMALEGASVDIATDLFTIQNLAKTMTMLEVANGRLGADIGVFTKIIGDVPNTFAGETIPWAGGFQASLNNIGKWLLAESTLTLSGDITEDVVVPVFLGARLNIKLSAGTNLTGSIIFRNCGNVRMYADAQNTTNIIATGSNYAVLVEASCVEMVNLHISGKARPSAGDGTYAAVYCVNASALTVTNVTVDRTNNFALFGSGNCKIDIRSCKGGVSGGDYTTLSNLGWGAYVENNSDMSLNATCPFGASGGATQFNGRIQGTATNTPTDGTTPSPPSVKSYAISTGYAAKAETSGSSSVSWSAGKPRQGSWGEYVEDWGYTVFYVFGVFLLTGAANIVSDRPSGKTITAATLKIRRDATTGGSGAISCNLHQHNLTSAPSGAPNTIMFAQAADTVSVRPNEEVTITLNSSAITNLNNGTCKGFGFRSSGGYGRYDVYGELVVTYS